MIKIITTHFNNKFDLTKYQLNNPKKFKKDKDLAQSSSVADKTNDLDPKMRQLDEGMTSS